jgi:energy-coupling factor transport system permease protein
MSGLIWGDSSASEFGTLTLESTQSGLNMLSRFFSFAGLGLIISLTTDATLLIKAMQKNGRISRKFAYGIMAAIHLIPHIKMEYQNARLAFAVRGVAVSPLSTKVLFAMLVGCFRWSEMLAIAMHSKGFYD